MDKLAETVLNAAIDILTPALLTLATAAVGLLIKWLHTKLKIEVGDDTRSELRRLASDAVDLANELAHQAVKRVTTTPGTNEKPMTSDDKFRFAVNALMEGAKKHKLTRARAENLILIAVNDARKWEDSK